MPRFVNRLEARAVIDMCYRRKGRTHNIHSLPQVRCVGHRLPVSLRERHPISLADRGHEQHVGTLLAGLKIKAIARALSQHDRRKGPEALTELDLEIHGCLHAGLARVANNAPRPQRPRSKLHPPVKPANNLALGDHLRNVVEQLSLPGVPFVRRIHFRQKAFDELVGIPRPEQAALLAIEAIGLAGVVHKLMPNEQCRPQRAAGIARRRLNPDILERPFPQQPPVANAVERHAASQHEILHLRLSLHLPRHPQHDLLGHRLDARRQIHVPLFELGFRPARRPAEQLGEPAIGHRQPLAVIEVRHVHPEAPVRPQIDQVLEDHVLINGPTVGSQAHQLIFAAVDLEPAVISERRIEQPQRVRKLELLEKAQLVPLALAERRRAPLAHAVQCQNSGLLIRARKKGAGGMALVVVRKDKPRLARQGKALAQRPAHVELILEPKRHRQPKAAKARWRVSQVGLQQPVELRQRLVIKGNTIQVLRLESCLAQTICDGVCRKAGVMFPAGEPLLLSRGDDIAIHYQRRGAVMIESRYAENCGHVCQSPAPIQTRSAAGSRLAPD